MPPLPPGYALDSAPQPQQRPDPTFFGQPREFLAKRASELQQEAQHQTDLAMGPESTGHSVLSRLGHRLLSLAPETAAVIDKTLAGGMDWKNVPAIAAGAVDPAIPAAYFATQGTGQLTGLTPGIERGNTSPENVQNALLAASMVTGAGGTTKAPTAGRATVGARNIVADVSPRLRSVAQEALNIGPRQTEAALVPYQKQIAKIADSNDAALAEHAQATQDLMNRYDARVEQIKQLNNEKLEGWRQKVSEINAKNAADIKQWQETVDATNALNSARRAQVGERAQLANDIGQNGTQLATQLKDLEASVRAQGSQMFTQLYDATKGIAADQKAVSNAIAGAEKRYLTTPQEVNQFKAIVGDVARNSELDGIARSLGYSDAETAIAKVGENTFMQWADKQAMGQAPGFAEIHGIYKHLGRVLGTRDLPGGVFQAIKSTYNAVGGEMQRIADAAGPEASTLNQSARAYWRNYENAFHDMRAVSQGGSPLARAYRAVDPDYAVAPFVGPAGARAISTLKGYSPELAQLAQETVNRYNHMQSLPKTAIEKALPAQPEALVRPAQPGMKALPPRPTPPPAPELQAYPRFDPRDAKLEILQKVAERARGEQGWGLYSDIGALIGGTYKLLTGNVRAGLAAYSFPLARRLAGRALENPSLADWLTKPTTGEVQAGLAARSPQRLNDVRSVMDAAKNGEISPGQADRLIRQLGQSSRVRRLPPPPP